jgi:hypothetical protein
MLATHRPAGRGWQPFTSSLDMCSVLSFESNIHLLCKCLVEEDKIKQTLSESFTKAGGPRFMLATQLEKEQP